MREWGQEGLRGCLWPRDTILAYSSNSFGSPDLLTFSSMGHIRNVSYMMTPRLKMSTCARNCRYR